MSLPYRLAKILSITAETLISAFSILDKWLWEIIPSFCKSDCLMPNSMRVWYNFPANFSFSRVKSLAFT